VEMIHQAIYIKITERYEETLKILDISWTVFKRGPAFLNGRTPQPTVYGPCSKPIDSS